MGILGELEAVLGRFQCWQKTPDMPKEVKMHSNKRKVAEDHSRAPYQPSQPEHEVKNLYILKLEGCTDILALVLILVQIPVRNQTLYGI